VRHFHFFVISFLFFHLCMPPGRGSIAMESIR
jgi:hypothetical protein